MTKRNPKSPWNPADSVDITPEEFEKQVVDWLSASSGTLEQFNVKHHGKLEGSGGEYEFDAVAKCSMLGGAEITIIVECKRHKRPIERKEIMVLRAKLQDVKANKGMLFSTSGFQSGALKYAAEYRIATVTLVEGNFFYETRGMITTAPLEKWSNRMRYGGIMLSWKDGNIQGFKISGNEIGPLKKWLLE